MSPMSPRTRQRRSPNKKPRIRFWNSGIPLPVKTPSRARPGAYWPAWHFRFFSFFCWPEPAFLNSILNGHLLCSNAPTNSCSWYPPSAWSISAPTSSPKWPTGKSLNNFSLLGKIRGRNKTFFSIGLIAGSFWRSISDRIVLFYSSDDQL